ncbi:MAG TPA: glycogen debranching enzyme N-terminal domain-containing protein [Chloroflexota bacterium]|nr:glycogen debranching enzyme N-terminal domain-containing protein [Chloroflexota bacterium]
MTTLLPGQSRSGEGAATTATDANGLAVFDLPHLSHSILDHPLISFGPDIAADVPSALRREWLVTNGLGGYASGTLAGVNTRRYHGLLVAALAPPVERMVLVAGSIDSATYDGHRFPLSTHEYGDGTVDPHGYRQIVSFALEGTLPVWTYAVGDALLEQRIWMAQSTTTTYVMYRVVRASRDSGYHQGPVWTWLLGPYAEAHYRVYGDRSAALALLEPVEHHLRDACLGSVSEIVEGDPPHRPVGCVAQAWGVAETLRVWRALSGTGSPLS